ncbi:MBL fold metallo-hydrolase [Leptospira mtsangambouensis]|nr:MBL fold metallo-hydrolase [Leptospira mtsangambouensis]
MINFALISNEVTKKRWDSPNYKDGAFHNLDGSKTMAEGASLLGIVYDYLISRQFVREPSGPIPTIKTNLKNLPKDKDLYVWFGHSSFLLQLNGQTILIDPAFSGYASPVSFSNLAYPGTDVYAVDDFPDIDYLLITHDHYDHLDLKTISKLKDKIRNVVVPLGIGDYFRELGFTESVISEKDWFDEVILANDDKLILTPTKHSSGRSIFQNQTLWTSYVILSEKLKIYISGDGGYGPHFSEYGKKYGPFTIAILENGQYRKIWKNVHSFPEEVIQTAKDLQTQYLIPVHSSKFTMALHEWDEPLKRIHSLGIHQNINVVTPMIGEALDLSHPETQCPKWWEKVK